MLAVVDAGLMLAVVDAGLMLAVVDAGLMLAVVDAGLMLAVVDAGDDPGGRRPGKFRPATPRKIESQSNAILSGKKWHS